MIVDGEELLNILAGVEIDTWKYELVEARRSGKTVLFHDGKTQTYLHSKYDPMRSAEQFAKEVYTDEPVIVLYGLGLGYHVEALGKLLLPEQMLYVFEADMQMVKLAFEETAVLRTLEKDNIVFYCGEDLKAFVLRMDSALKFADDNLNIYMPSLKTVPESMIRLGDVLTQYKAAKDMLPYHGERMEQNAQRNAAADYRQGIRLLKGCYAGLPAVVVAAGASLEENIHQLKEVQDKILIIAATRIARRLREAGIHPDYYVATDALPWLWRHLDFETMDTPLFLLSTADSMAEQYKGEKLIVYEKSAAIAGEEAYAVETGGSVATCALSISVLLGADPVLMLGQDLCFVTDNTHSGISPKRQPLPKGAKTVKGTDGKEYPTLGSLHIYLKWIERFIARNRTVRFYNATARGAEIEGAPHVGLVDFLKDFKDISKTKEKIKRDKNIL